MDYTVSGSTFHLGVLGGGQLGRMLIQEAVNFDIHIHVLENDPNAPCAKIAHSFTRGDIKAFDDVYAFGKNKDVLTVEIEDVNIEALKALEKEGVKIFPQPHILETIKDKGIQKKFYADNGIPTAPFAIFPEHPDKDDLKQWLPFVQKLRTGGYDGKGVSVIRTEADLEKAFVAPSVVEHFVPFEKELSVIVARNETGETAVYPVVECEFNAANLVEFLFSPAEISPETEERAKQLALSVINALDMVGILAVELFLTHDGTLLVNEIAPRPHNSGHHTIECNTTSQFEQHLRSITNLPLGSTTLLLPGAMINLIGAEGYTGKVVYQGMHELLKIDGLHPHLYGKEDTKPNRKMGHVTITGQTLTEVKQKARLAESKIKIISA